MNMLKLIASSNFITVNKDIAKQFGLHESVVMGVLCSWHIYCDKHNLLTENGYFPLSVNALRENTTLGGKAQKNALDNLADAGLIEQRNMGNPCVRHFRINEERLIEVLTGNFQFDQKDETSSAETDEPVQPKGQNYIDNNNINIISKKNVEEEYIDESRISVIINAWNSQKHTRTKIESIPFGTKRFTNTQLCVSMYGFDRFVAEIQNLDGNSFFQTWQPTYEWFCDPNKFLNVLEGKYRNGRETASGKPDYYKELLEWAKDDEDGNN